MQLEATTCSSWYHTFDCYSTGHLLPFFPAGPRAGQVNAAALPLIGADIVQNLIRADIADGPRIIDNDHPGFNDIETSMMSLKYVTDLSDTLTLLEYFLQLMWITNLV